MSGHRVTVIPVTPGKETEGQQAVPRENEEHMQRNITVILVAVVAILAAPAAFAALSDFTGTWVNIDPQTRGITKVVITTSPTPPDDPHVTVHAWGQCVPTDCDWGAVLAHAYCTNVQCNMVATARSITAVFTTGFSQTILVIRRAGTRLRVEAFDRFTDNSNRRNYDAVYTFKRQLIPVPAFEQPYQPTQPPQPPQ